MFRNKKEKHENLRMAQRFSKMSITRIGRPKQMTAANLRKFFIKYVTIQNYITYFDMKHRDMFFHGTSKETENIFRVFRVFRC